MNIFTVNGLTLCSIWVGLVRVVLLCENAYSTHWFSQRHIEHFKMYFDIWGKNNFHHRLISCIFEHVQYRTTPLVSYMELIADLCNTSSIHSVVKCSIPDAIPCAIPKLQKCVYYYRSMVQNVRLTGLNWQQRTSGDLRVFVPQYSWNTWT